MIGRGRRTGLRSDSSFAADEDESRILPAESLQIKLTANMKLRNSAASVPVCDQTGLPADIL